MNIHTQNKKRGTETHQNLLSTNESSDLKSSNTLLTYILPQNAQIKAKHKKNKKAMLV